MPSQIKPDAIAKAAVESGMLELPVRSSAAAHVCELPRHHRDPFDRLLIAQAIAEPAKFCTVDKALAAYGKLVQFAGEKFSQRVSRQLRVFSTAALLEMKVLQ